MQVGLSNISLSFLRRQYNITGPFSFSMLYNFSTDVDKISPLSISELIGKYRNFIPININNCVLWYDANNRFINNQEVSLLRDLSGNSNNAIQNNIINRPIYLLSGLGTNTNPSIIFYDSLQTNNKFFNINLNNTLSTSNITFGFVANTFSNKKEYLFGTNNDIINIYFNTNSRPVISINNINQEINNIQIDYVPSIFIFKLYIDIDGFTKSEVRINGVNMQQTPTIYTNTIPRFTMSNLFLGASPNSNYSTLNGNISEFVMYNSSINNNDILQLEGYFASKWWDIPSYVLPENHKYYNIPVLTSNSPIIFYNFNKNTYDSNVILLYNYGTEGSFFNATINNTFSYFNKVIYYPTFTNEINHLFINYRFDSANLSLNNGNSGTSYNITNPSGKIATTSDFVYGNSCINLLINEFSISQSALNFNTFRNSYTFCFWYRVLAFNSGNETLLSFNNDNSFYIRRNNNTNNLIISFPNNQNNIIINNSIFVDTNWRHIALTIEKKETNNSIINVYLNGIIAINNLYLINGWFNNNNNQIVINHNSSSGSVLYEDFKFYTRSLLGYEIQCSMGFPITFKNGIKNSYSCLWNYYNTSLQTNYNNFSLNYTSFINIIYNSISYNLQLLYDNSYNSNMDILIIHCNNNGTDRLKIYHRFLTSGTSYIKLIINNVAYYFNNISKDKLIHSFVFLFTPTIKLFCDGVEITTVSIASPPPEPLINGMGNYVFLGMYFNNVATLTTCPYSIEDFKIFSRQIIKSEIDYLNSNYAPDFNFQYRKNKSYPFSFIKFDKTNNSNISFGPSYNNMMSYYNSNFGNWIYNRQFLDNINGIQVFLTPTTGYYELTCAGAASGTSFNNNNIGRGIINTNIVYLTSNDILHILTGQKGGNGKFAIRPDGNSLLGMGGSGGSSMIINYTSNIPLLISGAGSAPGYTQQNNINVNGRDATNTTFSVLDFTNKGTITFNGMSGNLGSFGSTQGYGVSSAGFYQDGKQGNPIFGGSYAAPCYSNILLGSNIGLPYFQSLNSYGEGGFPSGSHGGTVYSLDLIWGPSGSSGYSSGCGSSALNNFADVSGGGAGGSYDINGVLNYSGININEGINGYNIGDGYVKIKFISVQKFIEYANVINSNILLDNLKLIFKPYNIFSYNKLIQPSIIYNLVDGKSASINGNYTNTNISIILNNISNNTLNNNSCLSINVQGTLRTLSIFYKILSYPPANSFLTECITDNSDFINDTNISKNWTNNGFLDSIIGTDGTCYYDTSNEDNNFISWDRLIYNNFNNWRYITLTSHSNINNEIVLFGNKNYNSCLNVEIGAIMVYDRELTFAEHLYNYKNFANIYNSSYIYSYNGNIQYFKVPDNVFKINIRIWGAGGSSSFNTSTNNGFSFGYGGSGAYVNADIDVLPGDILNINVASGGNYPTLSNPFATSGYPENIINNQMYIGGNGGNTKIILNSKLLFDVAGGTGAGAYSGNISLYTLDYIYSITQGWGGGDLITSNNKITEFGNFITANKSSFSFIDNSINRYTILKGNNGSFYTSNVISTNGISLDDVDIPQGLQINYGGIPSQIGNNGGNSLVLIKCIY